MEFIQRDETPQGKRIIQIGFFKGPGGGCTAVASSQYTHVELRFSDGSVTSITRDPGTVHYTQGRTLSNPLYSCFFQVAVEPETEDYMQRRAERFSRDAEMRFSYTAMIWNFAPITRNWPMEGLFCSQYVCKLLQMALLVTDLNPLTTSPDDLFEALKKDVRFAPSFNKCLFSW